MALHVVTNLVRLDKRKLSFIHLTMSLTFERLRILDITQRAKLSRELSYLHFEINRRILIIENVNFKNKFTLQNCFLHKTILLTICF